VEVIAVIMLTGEFVALNHGAHGTIENQNPLGESLEQYLVTVNQTQKDIS